MSTEPEVLFRNTDWVESRFNRRIYKQQFIVRKILCQRNIIQEHYMLKKMNGVKSTYNLQLSQFWSALWYLTRNQNITKYRCIESIRIEDTLPESSMPLNWRFVIGIINTPICGESSKLLEHRSCVYFSKAQLNVNLFRLHISQNPLKTKKVTPGKWIHPY